MWWWWFQLDHNRWMGIVNKSSLPEFFPHLPQGFAPMPTIRFFCIICGTVLEGTPDSRADVMVCPSCAHHVPVPSLAGIPAGADGCGPVFPPGVLEVSVKFLCTACQSPLRADARWEGHSVECPVCHEMTAIPRWSGLARWPSTFDTGKHIQQPVAVKLSTDEIEFLSTASLGKTTAGV